MSSKVPKSKFKNLVLEVFPRVELPGESIDTDRGVPSLIARKPADMQNSSLDSLVGSVIRYEAPLEPVKSDEWEVLR